MDIDEPVRKKRKRGKYLEEFVTKFQKKIEGSCTNEFHLADTIECSHAHGSWKCTTAREHNVTMQTDPNGQAYLACDCNGSYYCKHIVATIINILSTQADKADKSKTERETLQQAMSMLNSLSLT